MLAIGFYGFFFSSRRRHTRLQGDWSSDVCSSDLGIDGSLIQGILPGEGPLAGEDALDQAAVDPVLRPVARANARALRSIKRRHHTTLVCAAAVQRKELAARPAVYQYRIERSAGGKVRQWVDRIEQEPNGAIGIVQRGKFADLDSQYPIGLVRRPTI